VWERGPAGFPILRIRTQPARSGLVWRPSGEGSIRTGAGSITKMGGVYKWFYKLNLQRPPPGPPHQEICRALGRAYNSFEPPKRVQYIPLYLIQYRGLDRRHGSGGGRRVGSPTDVFIG